MAAAITVERFAGAISAATISVDEAQRRIAVSIWSSLADGHPVTSRELAERSGVSESVIDDALETWPGVFRDGERSVIGFWGLAIPPMEHRFHAAGGRPIHAWCALDPFLIVPVIGRSARVESKDPVTGEPIAMTVTPTGISDVSPASAVVSLLVPDQPFDMDVIQSFCNFVHFFADEASAQRWAGGRDGIVVRSVYDAFEIGRRAWKSFKDPDQ